MKRRRSWSSHGSVLITCVTRHWTWWILYYGKALHKSEQIVSIKNSAHCCLNMVSLQLGGVGSMKRKKTLYCSLFLLFVSVFCGCRCKGAHPQGIDQKRWWELDLTFFRRVEKHIVVWISLKAWPHRDANRHKFLARTCVIFGRDQVRMQVNKVFLLFSHPAQGSVSLVAYFNTESRSRDGAVVRELPSHQEARARFTDPASYVGWVCCWFSSLLRGFFSRFSGFPKF